MVLKKFLVNLIIVIVGIVFFILFRTITKIPTPTWLALMILFTIMSIVNGVCYKE